MCNPLITGDHADDTAATGALLASFAGLSLHADDATRLSAAHEDGTATPVSRGGSSSPDDHSEYSDHSDNSDHVTSAPGVSSLPSRSPDDTHAAGVVLDLHQFEILVKQRSFDVAWWTRDAIAVLEQELVAMMTAAGAAPSHGSAPLAVTQRFAADSELGGDVSTPGRSTGTPLSSPAQRASSDTGYVRQTSPSVLSERGRRIRAAAL